MGCPWARGHGRPVYYICYKLDAGIGHCIPKLCENLCLEIRDVGVLGMCRDTATRKWSPETETGTLPEPQAASGPPVRRPPSDPCACPGVVVVVVVNLSGTLPPCLRRILVPTGAGGLNQCRPIGTLKRYPYTSARPSPPCRHGLRHGGAIGVPTTGRAPPGRDHGSSRPHGTISTFAIMPWSSCSSLWQCSTSVPVKRSVRKRITPSAGTVSNQSPTVYRSSLPCEISWK